SFSSGLPLSLDIQPAGGGRRRGTLLRQCKRQHAVVVGAADFLALDIGNIKAAAKGAIGALPAQVLAVVILLLCLRATVGGNRHAVAVDVHRDVLFLHAGQVGLQLVVVALIFNIGV